MGQNKLLFSMTVHATLESNVQSNHSDTSIKSNYKSKACNGHLSVALQLISCLPLHATIECTKHHNAYLLRHDVSLSNVEEEHAAIFLHNHPIAPHVSW